MQDKSKQHYCCFFFFLLLFNYATWKPISHSSLRDSCEIGFRVQFNAEFPLQVMNFPLTLWLNRWNFLLYRKLGLHDCLFVCFLPLRLASTHERRLKIRQVNVENTSELNSPSEVEKDFRDFFDNERMEAWNIIETSLFSTHTVEDDVKKRYLACMIFVVSNYAYDVQNNANCFSFLNLLHLSNTPEYERPCNSIIVSLFSSNISTSKDLYLYVEFLQIIAYSLAVSEYSHTSMFDHLSFWEHLP